MPGARRKTQDDRLSTGKREGLLCNVVVGGGGAVAAIGRCVFLHRRNPSCRKNGPAYFGLILTFEKGFASDLSTGVTNEAYQPNVETVSDDLRLF